MSSQLSDSSRPPSRAPSRASSRLSVRSQNDKVIPSSSEYPVSNRNHVPITNKKRQHSQSQGSDNSTPRSPPVSLGRSISHSPTEPSYPPFTDDAHDTTHTIKSQRRSSSFEVLHSLAGPDSQLPLPKKEGVIREGVPSEFSPLREHNKRSSSPTRTLSRIPVASVGHARTLAEDGQQRGVMSPNLQRSFSPIPDSLTTSTSSLHLPSSPRKRLSFGASGGNTTKVLADLQAGVINAKNALENTKAQLRMSQRTVAQLTRQTEDLKDGRERLRLENEGLNNVVARKERLLQEVLDRARKAEAEAASLKAQLKSDTSSYKRSVREMETQVQQSTAVSTKCEREYLTLRDSIKHLSEGWKTDVDKLKKEMNEREGKLRKEAEEMGEKYRKLLEQVEKEREGHALVAQIREEERRTKEEWENHLKTQIDELRASMHSSFQETTTASRIAERVSDELLRLRSLIRAVERDEEHFVDQSLTN